MWWWWQAAYRALKPGGVLVFADRAFDERWEAYMRSGRAEAERHMHPTSHGPPDEQLYFVGRKPRNTQKAERWAARMEAMRNASVVRGAPSR